MSSDSTSEQESPRRSRRGSRTRHDRGTRTLLLAPLGLFGVGMIVLIIVLAVSRPASNQRRYNVVPRNIDIWQVYPGSESKVRFVSLFYPGTADARLTETQMAGPLVSGEDTIESSRVLGGEETGMELIPYDPSSGYAYPMFNIGREPGSAMYGIDVLTTESVYIAADAAAATGEETPLVIALGVELQKPDEPYQQQIVAVAFPKDTEILDVTMLDPDQPADPMASSFPAYRTTTLGDWAVYYFDTTLATRQDPDAIRITFRWGDMTNPSSLDPLLVDRKR